MRPCKLGVVREGNGDGLSTVFWPEGRNRVFFLKMASPHITMSYKQMLARHDEAFLACVHSFSVIQIFT